MRISRRQVQGDLTFVSKKSPEFSLAEAER